MVYIHTAFFICPSVSAKNRPGFLLQKPGRFIMLYVFFYFVFFYLFSFLFFSSSLFASIFLDGIDKCIAVFLDLEFADTADVTECLEGGWLHLRQFVQTLIR